MRRIGTVYTAPLARLQDCVDTVRESEALGFTSAWQAEDLGGPDAVSLLASYAQVTSSLTLGTAITTPYTRHPAVLASTFATLDDLSAGRVILGLGAGTGWWDRLTLDRDAMRPIGDMAETIRAFRELVSQGETVYHGQPIKLRHAFPWQDAPPPLIRLHIPVYLGAQRPQMVRLAGRVADGLILELAPVVTSTAQRIQDFHAAAREAGRDPGTLDIVALVMVAITPDGSIPPYLQQNWLAPRVSRISDEQAVLRGHDPQRLARLRQAVADGRLDAAADLLTPELIRGCGAFGTLDQCLEKLEELVAFGVNEPILYSVDPDPRSVLELGRQFVARG
jgi:5,10-methylenetetrahydromethanopterin reductase